MIINKLNSYSKKKQTMQKLMLIGRIGQDAVVRNVNGKSVINFSVCHSERWKDNSGTQHEKSTWFSCSYFTEKTNIAQYIRKGAEIYCEGTVGADIYNNKASLTCRVTNIQLLGSNPNNNSNQPQQQTQNTATDISQDDLPF